VLSYDGSMRYAQQGGYTPAEQQRRERERLRLKAAERFARGDSTSEIAADLRVAERTVRRWRQVWRDGGAAALRSRRPVSPERPPRGPITLKFSRESLYSLAELANANPGLKFSRESLYSLAELANANPGWQRIQDIARPLGDADVWIKGSPGSRRVVLEILVLMSVSVHFRTKGVFRTGGVVVEMPTPSLPMWASPQSMALATWLTAFLTLITVILAFAAMEKDKAPAPTPTPVQIVIVIPGEP
jgi:transposase